MAGRDERAAHKSLSGGAPLISLPETFPGELREYQHKGVSWLTHLRRAGFGGVLADDIALANPFRP